MQQNALSLRGASLAERFASKCGPKEENGCIPWMGKLLNSGYGQIRNGRHGRTTAHRAAWTIAHGPISDGLYVLHNCDNKRCVNVEHLRLGTQSENMADAMQRGQHPFSKSPPPWQKLSDDDVLKVLALRTAGHTQRSIAARFSVSRSLISLITSGKEKRTARLTNGIGDYHR